MNTRNQWDIEQIFKILIAKCELVYMIINSNDKEYNRKEKGK